MLIVIYDYKEQYVNWQMNTFNPDVEQKAAQMTKIEKGVDPR